MIVLSSVGFYHESSLIINFSPKIYKFESLIIIFRTWSEKYENILELIVETFIVKAAH
jgi:hypothetical protein